MSRLPLFLIAACAGAGALSACAPTAATETARTASSPRQCFYADQVDNFRANNQTLYVRARNKDVFELQTLGFCNDLDTAFGITLLPTGAINRLCVNDMSRLATVGGADPASPCRVQVVKKLTEAEIEALPARDRP